MLCAELDIGEITSSSGADIATLERGPFTISGLYTKQLFPTTGMPYRLHPGELVLCF